ncbi:PilZ domain-containing protein [Novosphingobium sp.]|uniref:PilZ domain-containing protein n=1 Tax=Novosphingobium sp. TaxID=1874826 RepID=UPI003BAADC9D
MEPAVKHQSPSQHPRDNRERRLLKGQMQTDRLPGFEIVIRNISARGLCATCKGLPPVVGEFAEIHLPDNRTVMANVRWTNDQIFGVEFEEPINLAIMMDTLQRLRDLADRNASWEVKSKHRVSDHRPDVAMLRRL